MAIMDEVNSLLDQILQRCEEISTYDPLNRDAFALPVKVPHRPDRPPSHSLEIESNAVDSWSILPDRIKYLGSLPPDWQADEVVTDCLGCTQPFGFIRRKHHCRACGRVFCSGCTASRIKLAFSSDEDSRVCAECYEIIPEVYRLKSDVVYSDKTLNSSFKTGASNDKLEKSVRFIDGIGPAKVEETAVEDPDGRNADLPVSERNGGHSISGYQEWAMYTRVASTGSNGGLSQTSLTSQLKDSEGVVFQIRSSVYCKARMSTLSCCTGQRCLSLSTMGLCKVASDELFFAFEFGSITKVGPIIKWLLRLIEHYYEDAGDGMRPSLYKCVDVRPECPCPVGNVAAFLFTKPTRQCLANLATPNSAAYLVAIPVCKEEIPLAKCLPTRILIQMGSEYNVFPFPVVLPIRRRPLAIFADQTVLRLFCDFRNFLFTIPIIDKMRIRIEPPNTVRISIAQLAMPAVVEAFRVQYCQETRRIADTVTLACGIGGSSNENSYVTYAPANTKRFTDNPGEYRGTNLLFVVFLSSTHHLAHKGFKCRRIDDGIVFHFTKRQMEVIAGYMTTGKEKSITICDRDKRQTLVINWTKGCRPHPASFRSPIDGKCLDDFPRKVMVDPLVERAAFNINWTTIVVLRGLLFRDLERTYQRLIRVALEFVACLKVECISKPIALRISCSYDEVGYETNCEDPNDNLTKEDLGTALLPILDDLASENSVYELHFHAEYF